MKHGIALGLAAAIHRLKTAVNGKNHHLIALFSTVAAIRQAATRGVTIICNEIKDLERNPKGLLGKKPLPHKHLLNAVQVNSQPGRDSICIHEAR